MPELEPTVLKIARFLGAQEDDVRQLLEARRLDGALLTNLQRRGVSLTPSVKNSVRALVRQIELQRTAPAAAPPSDSEAISTIMFTDIVDSTRMMERLGDRRGRQVFARHDEIVRESAMAHGGKEVKSLGDGFMLAFRSAVACAVDVQRGLRDHNRDNPDTPIRVRVGLSVGEPIEDNSDLFGMVVNMAARITDQAAGGQVLVAQIVHELASSAREFEFRPVDPVELKGIDGTQQLYEVLWDRQPVTAADVRAVGIASRS